MIWKTMIGAGVAAGLSFGLIESGVGFSWLPHAMRDYADGDEAIVMMGLIGAMIGLAFGVIDR